MECLPNMQTTNEVCIQAPMKELASTMLPISESPTRKGHTRKFAVDKSGQRKYAHICTYRDQQLLLDQEIRHSIDQRIIEHAAHLAVENPNEHKRRQSSLRCENTAELRFPSQKPIRRPYTHDESIVICHMKYTE